MVFTAVKVRQNPISRPARSVSGECTSLGGGRSVLLHSCPCSPTKSVIRLNGSDYPSVSGILYWRERLPLDTIKERDSQGISRTVCRATGLIKSGKGL